MTYEINVSLDGRHYFATHERSLRTEEQAKEVFDKLKEAFPEREGYELSVTKYQTSGKRIKF